MVEIAPDRGWSTTWLVAGLRDNGTGHLYSYDIFDHATKVVPQDLSQLVSLKRELGLEAPIHTSQANPMSFLEM